jgi:hypothetical protein
MKKLLVLTAVVMLTASSVGCQCCDWLRRGSCFSNGNSEMSACNSCNPCDPCMPSACCDPCAPGGFVSGGYGSGGYAPSGCATGNCAPGTFSGTPATVLPGPAN